MKFDPNLKIDQGLKTELQNLLEHNPTVDVGPTQHVGLTQPILVCSRFEPATPVVLLFQTNGSTLFQHQFPDTYHCHKESWNTICHLSDLCQRTANKYIVDMYALKMGSAMGK